MALFRRFLINIKLFLHSFFNSLKNVEDEIIITKEIKDKGSYVINNEKQSLVKSLLQGEVTKEVEELRYRTYKIDRESKKYKVYTSTLAKRISDDTYKKLDFENKDNLEVITVQPNRIGSKSLEEELKHYDKGDKTYKESDGESLISIEYKDFTPKFNLEKYLKLLIIKKKEGESSYILDLYFNKYFDKFNYLQNFFIKDLIKLKEEGGKRDYIDIEYINFSTLNAWKYEDMKLFEFGNLIFREIIEYEGFYILRYRAKAITFNYDLQDKFFSRSMYEKYENKEVRTKEVDLFLGEKKETYKCESCGKEFVFDTSKINSISNRSKVAIEENGEIVIQDGEEDLSYLDLFVSENLTGHKICKDCMVKYISDKK